MKSIIVSLPPERVAEILNGDATIEILKTAPKYELPIDVYIYCTKGGDILWTNVLTNNFYLNLREDHVVHGVEKRNGKVVAKFTLRKVEPICCETLSNGVGSWGYYYTESINDIRKDSALEHQDLRSYLGVGKDGKQVGYVYHISNLQIFDKPMELSDFHDISEDEMEKEAEGILETMKDSGYPSDVAICYEDEHTIFFRIMEELLEKHFIKRPPSTWRYVEL